MVSDPRAVEVHLAAVAYPLEVKKTRFSRIFCGSQNHACTVPVARHAQGLAVIERELQKLVLARDLAVGGDMSFRRYFDDGTA